RPRGLIDYVTLEDAEREAAGEPARPAWKALLRPRTIAYFLIWGSVGLGMLFALGARPHTEISAEPDRNPPFMLMSDGSVRNAYTVKLRNMESRPRERRVSLEGLPGAVMWTDEMPREDAVREIVATVAPDAAGAIRIYVVAPAGTEQQEFTFAVTTLDASRETDSTETRFSAPEE